MEMIVDDILRHTVGFKEHQAACERDLYFKF